MRSTTDPASAKVQKSPGLQKCVSVRFGHAAPPNALSVTGGPTDLQNQDGLTTYCNKYKAFSNSNQSACCLVTLRFLVVVPVPQDTLQRSHALQSPTVQSLEASRVSSKCGVTAEVGKPSGFWAADVATISHIGLILGGLLAFQTRVPKWLS